MKTSRTIVLVALMAAGCLAAEPFEHTAATTGTDGTDGGDGGGGDGCGDSVCAPGELGSTCPADCATADPGCASELTACGADNDCTLVIQCEVNQDCGIVPPGIACEDLTNPNQPCGGVGSCVSSLGVTPNTVGRLCNVYACLARVIF